MSFEPVPLRPETCQVSWIVTSAAGRKNMRVLGSMPGSISGLPSLVIRQPPMIHCAFWVPEPHCQRPETW